MVDRLNIYYHHEGADILRCSVCKFTFHDTVMGEQYILFDVESPTQIPFAVGDFCTFRGQEYTLNYEPSETQQAEAMSTGSAFVYQNVKMNSDADELTRCIVLDVVPTSGAYSAEAGTNYTGAPSFTLYCGETVYNGRVLSPVHALATKLQTNLDRLYRGEKKWNILVNDEKCRTKDFTISFANWTVAQALAEVKNTFDLFFSIVGRTIYIGYDIDDLSTDAERIYTFGFGRGNGTREDEGRNLFSLSRTANSNQQIITRLRAFGSSKNLPYRWYNDHYSLPQSLFINKLQLPDTYLTPQRKAEANMRRDEEYHDEEGAGLLSHVLGDSNDAYIDVGNDAEASEIGIREGVAYWDGSNSDLDEIYPTLEGITYGDLRAISDDTRVHDIDGNTGPYAYQGISIYGNEERVDELLGVDDDANIGDGIMSESSSSGRVLTSGNISQGDTPVINERIYRESAVHAEGGGYLGGEYLLWRIDDVQYAGKYQLSPTLTTDHNVTVILETSERVEGNEALTRQTNHCFRILVKATYVSSGESEDIYVYQSGFTQKPYYDLPALPKEGEDIILSEAANISIYIQVLASISDEHQYSTARLRIKTSQSQEAHYIWRPVNDARYYEDSTFHIFLKDLGFDLSNLKTSGSEPAQIRMTSGNCVGRTFNFNVNKIKQYTDIVTRKKGWSVECERDPDTNIGIYYPNDRNRLAQGDRFVLLNIDMPDTYIYAAEVRLLRAATDYLKDNSKTRRTYEPSIDNLFIQRDYDRNVGAGTPQNSIYWRLYAGLNLTFKEYASSESKSVTISQVEIKIGEEAIPQVSIQLNDENEPNALQKVTNSVNRLYNSIGGYSGSDLYIQKLLELIQSEGAKMFLSRLENDIARGNITFERAIKVLGGIVSDKLQSSVFESGLLGNGFSLSTDTNGHSRLEVDEVSVRLRAIFNELEIRKLSYSGGNILFSAAGSVITKVELGRSVMLTCAGAELVSGESRLVTQGDTELTEDDVTYYRCYFKQDDGTSATRNLWRVGDFARCQTFNIEDNGNKYYWRKVVGVGVDYVDLSNVSGEMDDTFLDYNGRGLEVDGVSVNANSVPAANDEIVQFGNDTEPSRQNAILLSVYGNTSPEIRQLSGISTFVITSANTVTLLSPSGNKIVGELILQSSSKRVEDAIEDAADIGGVNMLLGSRSVIITDTSENDNKHIGLTVGEPIYADVTYTISVGVASVRSGYGQRVLQYTVSLYDEDNGIALRLFTFDASSQQVWQSFSLTQSEIENAGTLKVRLYAGMAGSTAYNTASFTYVQLERGNHATSWKPNPSDYAIGLGYRNYAEMEAAAKDGQTIIQGGYIRTSLLNVDDIITKRLQTLDSNGAGIVIDNSIMRVFGNSGAKNIEFGVNESGYATLTYYDNAGNVLYDLGPNGISQTGLRFVEEWTDGTKALILSTAASHSDFQITAALQRYVFKTGHEAQYHEIFKYSAQKNSVGAIEAGTIINTQQAAIKCNGRYFLDHNDVTTSNYTDKWINGFVVMADSEIEQYSGGEPSDYGYFIYDIPVDFTKNDVVRRPVHQMTNGMKALSSHYVYANFNDIINNI